MLTYLLLFFAAIGLFYFNWVWIKFVRDSTRGGFARALVGVVSLAIFAATVAFLFPQATGMVTTDHPIGMAVYYLYVGTPFAVFYAIFGVLGFVKLWGKREAIVSQFKSDPNRRS